MTHPIRSGIIGITSSLPIMRHSFAALVVLVLLTATALADEVFLINGFVYRNVLVTDSTETVLRISYNGKVLDVRRTMIDHVVRAEVRPGRKARYELYSMEMSKSFESARLGEEERMQAREQAERDSAQALARRMHEEAVAAGVGNRPEDDRPPDDGERVRDSLDWRAHGYDRVVKYNGWNFAIGASHPLGFMVETGFRIGSVALAMVLSGGDIWSYEPSDVKIGLAFRIHIWNYVGTFDPYFGYITGTATGTHSSSQDEAENYKTFLVGTRVLLAPSSALTLELGYTRTSMYLPWHYDRNSLVEGTHTLDHAYLRFGLSFF